MHETVVVSVFPNILPGDASKIALFSTLASGVCVSKGVGRQQLSPQAWRVVTVVEVAYWCNHVMRDVPRFVVEPLVCPHFVYPRPGTASLSALKLVPVFL